MKECYGQCDRCVWHRVVGGCNPKGLEDDDDKSESGLLTDDE